MIDAPDLDGLLRRALLAYDSRALHAGGEAGVFAAAFLNRVADDVLEAMTASGHQVGGEYLAEVYRCLNLAADNPLQLSCRDRESLLNIACHGLAHALLRKRSQTHASEDEVHELLAGLWTASLLAWSQIFPARMDGVSTPCTCGALGTRQVLVPVTGAES